jgi:hypothetical protein
MLDILVREAFAARTLGQPHTFAECLVIGFAVCGVERTDRTPALDTYRHCMALERFDRGDSECMYDVMSDLLERANQEARSHGPAQQSPSSRRDFQSSSNLPSTSTSSPQSCLFTFMQSISSTSAHSPYSQRCHLPAMKTPHAHFLPMAIY